MAADTLALRPAPPDPVEAPPDRPAAGRPATAPAVEALLLTDREAAALCGLGRSTWRRLQAAGKVPPPVKLGRSCRYRKSELLAWIDAGCPDAKTWAALRATGKRLRVLP